MLKINVTDKVKFYAPYPDPWRQPTEERTMFLPLAKCVCGEIFPHPDEDEDHCLELGEDDGDYEGIIHCPKCGAEYVFKVKVDVFLLEREENMIVEEDTDAQ